MKRKKKKEEKEEKDDKSDTKTINPTELSDLPILLNIFNVETRRSIFTFTVYKIKVIKDNQSYDIERTWSDFKELHTQVYSSFFQCFFPSQKTNSS